MARKKTGGAAARSTNTARRSPRQAKARAMVRMYRHGLGDCLLVSLPRAGEEEYHILIDCGVILGTKDAAQTMQAVMQDVLERTGKKVDLLVATHEHGDHVSGFLQAADQFAQLYVAETWLAWTEDPDDPGARGLIQDRTRLAATLEKACLNLRAAEAHDTADRVEGLLSFFGAAGSTAAALEAVRTKSPGNLAYKRPSDPPVQPTGTTARIYVLGPPQDTALLRRHSPSRRTPETYGLEERLLLDSLDQARAGACGSPFAPPQGMPLQATRRLEFFQSKYWDDPPAPPKGTTVHEDGDNSWRRIDSDWLACATEFALKLDAMTNNTSLVLAIELDGGEVLLFAADAQVGNWLSWQDLRWEVEGRTVTGPDLLARTVLYKVGHHGSHNATLREKGLESMAGLQTALVPVDQAMACKKRWNHMPLPELIEALRDRAETAVIRSDYGVALRDGTSGKGIDAHDLWVDVAV